MNIWPIFSILIVIALIVVLFLAIAYNRNKGQKSAADYRTFFILGISMLPVGIATDNPGLWGMGAVFMVFGLANRDKWSEEPRWSELSPERRGFKLIILGGLAVLLLVSVLVYFLAKQGRP